MTVTMHLIVGLANAAIGAWIFWGFREDITQETSPSRGWGLTHSVFRLMGLTMLVLGLGLAFAPTATLWVLDQLGHAVFGGLKP